MSKKYCCEKFRFHCDTSVINTGINFRIIKIGDRFLKNGFSTNPYSYIITEDYDKLETKIRSIVIDYCPFCGEKLKRTYNDDQFVNEDDHDWK